MTSVCDGTPTIILVSAPSCINQTPQVLSSFNRLKNRSFHVVARTRTAATKNGKKKKKKKTCKACKLITVFSVVIMIALDRPIVRWFRGHSHNCPKLTMCLFNLVLTACNYFMIKISKLSQNTTNKEIKTYQLIKTSEYLLHWYWDLCTEILLNKNSDSNLTNRDHERQNFNVKKYRWSNQQCERKKFTHN